MSLKSKLKVRDVSRKYTEGVMLQVEELINTSKRENKFDRNVFPSLRDTIFEKIQQIEDLSVEFLNLMDEENDVMTEETLSTKTKVLTIHRYIEEQNTFTVFCSSQNPTLKITSELRLLMTDLIIRSSNPQGPPSIPLPQLYGLPAQPKYI